MEYGYILLYLCLFRDISEGEEVTDSYGVSFIETPRKIRQRKLLQQYKFECNCNACRENYPLFTDLDRNKVLDEVIPGQNCL